MDVVEDEIANLSRELARNHSEDHKETLEKALEVVPCTPRRLAEYYEKTRELARRITEWDMRIA